MHRPLPYADSRPFTIEEVDLDPPGDGELLIRIHAAGLCHSDLSTVNGDRPRSMPMVLGHEAAGLVVEYGTLDELESALGSLDGQLTATLRLGEGDTEFARRLLPTLELLAGRILVNGWPTGVEVGHAVVHGGPFPATSDSRTTSVGSLAIARFLRPVAYQNLPDELLPPELQEANPWRVPRRVDGRMVLPQ